MGKEEVIIEQAGPKHEEDVIRLWSQLIGTYFKEAEMCTLRKSYRYAVNHPRQVRIYIATRGEKVLGTASLHLGHISTWSNNWYGHVEDLIVEPEERRQGIANKLLLHIIEEAKKEKLSRLELHTLTHNTRAREMYEKLGFSTTSALYELPLE